MYVVPAAASPQDPAEAELRRARLALAAETARANRLETALLSNRRIGIAGGLTMAEHHLSAEDALEALRTESVTRDQPLTDIAEGIIDASTRPRVRLVKPH